MTGSTAPIVVLGVGNVLRGDDGVGVHVVRALEARVARGDAALPPGTRLVDGGTLGIDLLAWLAGAHAAVIVDATDAGDAPGTVTVLRDASLEMPPGPNRAGVAELLAAIRLTDGLPGGLALVGIARGSLEASAELGPAVRAALPAAVTATVDEVRRLAATAGATGPSAAGGTTPEPIAAGVTA